MIEQVNSLNDVKEPYAGKTVWSEEDKKAFRWDPIEGWQPIDMSGNFSMSAYDMNKQIMGQLQILDETALQEKKELIVNFVNNTNNVYYMLLCRDINYYTLFACQDTNPELLEDILIDECLPAIGQIKSIEVTEDGGAVEIWVQDDLDNVYAVYFFPYDAGVIVCS